MLEIYEEQVLNHLKQKFKKIGHDFYFKSRDLRKTIPTSSSTIGRVCTNLVKSGDLSIWNPSTSNRTYRTIFNNGHKQLQDYCEHCGMELTPSNMCNNPKCPEYGIIQVFKIDYKEKFIDEIKVEREVCK